jgi:hypothetical protein
MEFRISRTIEKYIEAAVIWGYSIDAAFEADMIKEFWPEPKKLSTKPSQSCCRRSHKIMPRHGSDCAS